MKQRKSPAATATKLEPIPQPPTVPFLGNLPDLDENDFNGSITHLAKKHGPIYRLVIPGAWRFVVLSSWSLVNEVCDDTRFTKSIEGDLEVFGRPKLSPGGVPRD